MEKRKVTMKECALAYAKKGYKVLPVALKDKRPINKNGCKGATSEVSVIGIWWLRNPKANIGVATGGTLFVLDVDAKSGGFESLQVLENKYGKLPPTFTVVTGGGGRHYYYKNPKEIDIRNSAGKLGAGLDVRGNGGYVVAPPSLHSSGNKYKKDEGSLGMPTPAPAWLLDLVRQDKATPTAKKKAEKEKEKPEKEQSTLMNSPSLIALCKGVKEGGRNDALTRLAGGLMRYHRGYLDPDLIIQLLFAWNDARCLPPLPRHEVLQVINSIAGAELSKSKLGKV
jgi:hypothetical protein